MIRPASTPASQFWSKNRGNLCASFLTSCDSQQVKLRAQLNFEAAKAEIASDFLTKAREHVDSTLALDYGHVTTSDIQGDVLTEIHDTLVTDLKKKSLRSLDPFLLDLQKQLSILFDRLMSTAIFNKSVSGDLNSFLLSFVHLQKIVFESR